MDKSMVKGADERCGFESGCVTGKLLRLIVVENYLSQLLIVTGKFIRNERVLKEFFWPVFDENFYAAFDAKNLPDFNFVFTKNRDKEGSSVRHT